MAAADGAAQVSNPVSERGEGVAGGECGGTGALVTAGTGVFVTAGAGVGAGQDGGIQSAGVFVGAGTGAGQDGGTQSAGVFVGAGAGSSCAEDKAAARASVCTGCSSCWLVAICRLARNCRTRL